MTDATLLAELAQLEAELHHPGTLCSRARLEALLHPAFHEIGRSGQPYTRTQVIDYLAARRDVPVVRLRDHQVQVLGAALALLTYRSDEVSDDGRPVRGAQRMSIWQRTEIGWQLRYHQGTPAAD